MRVFVAGHRGMVGSAIARKLSARGDIVITRNRNELDLTHQASVRDFFASETFDCVVLAAAKVGGIQANNSLPAEFIYENMMIEANVVHESFKSGVRRLLFLGSSCIYPRAVGQPMSEDALLTGVLEQTNEPYAVAKIAGIKLCESYNRQYGTDYRCVMPTNLYGPGDNFDLESSHVLPALIRKFHEAVETGAEEVTIWGTGEPQREFLHVEDMAEASLFILDMPYKSFWDSVQSQLSHLNIGFGSDVKISELASIIAEVTGYSGRIIHDRSKPDGTMKKLMDSSKINNFGWYPRIELRQGILDTYLWYKQNVAH